MKRIINPTSFGNIPILYRSANLTSGVDYYISIWRHENDSVVSIVNEAIMSEINSKSGVYRFDLDLSNEKSSSSPIYYVTLIHSQSYDESDSDSIIIGAGIINRLYYQDPNLQTGRSIDYKVYDAYGDALLSSGIMSELGSGIYYFPLSGFGSGDQYYVSVDNSNQHLGDQTYIVGEATIGGGVSYTISDFIEKRCNIVFEEPELIGIDHGIEIRANGSKLITSLGHINVISVNINQGETSVS